MLGDRCGVERIVAKPAEPLVLLAEIERILKTASTEPQPIDATSFPIEHLRVVTRKLNEKVQELTASEARLGALVTVSQRFAEERDPQALLDMVCTAARRVTGARYAIAGTGPARQQPSAFAAAGFADGSVPSPPSPTGALLTMLREDHGVVRGRVAPGDSERLGLAANPSAHSYVAAQVSTATRRYGWLLLINKLGADQFSEADEQVVVTLAAQGALAFENEQLLQDCRERTMQLTREMTERRRAEAAVAEQRLRVLQATMRTVQDIVFNAFNGLELIRFQAGDGRIPPESLRRFDEVIADATARLQALARLDDTPEIDVGGAVGIDYSHAVSE